jgi:hypothetical protein
MAFLEWLENTGFATWERESLSLFAYPLFLSLHTIGLGFVVGTSAAIDLRILGVTPGLPLAPMERYFRVVWFGFWVNALSGLVLLPTAAITFFTTPVFYIKLGAVAGAVVTLRLLRREVFRGHPASLDTTPLSTKAKTLAGTSLAFWVVAIFAGRLMAYSGFVQWATLRAFLVVVVVGVLAGFIATRLLRSRKQLQQAA